MASSLSLSASSSLSRNWEHSVFPSFHGPDVRYSFLSHVLKEFKSKGISPFIDNNIKRGEFIGPELKRAIRGSKILIVMLSRRYASSSWCLDELVEIMNKESGQTVVTIFYHLNPTDVKKQTGYFGEVFKETCIGKTEEKIGTWKTALEGVATIAGYHIREGFPLRLLMVDIKEIYPRPCLNEGSVQLKLQRKMLSKMLNHKDMEITDLGVARERLNGKKVFLILDEVDSSAQLEALAGGKEWYGGGSRIIIISENLRVLKAQGVNHIYEVGLPTTSEAFRMFCMYAFGQKNPKDGFTELAWEVTYLVDKLPLGLKVMGSHFKRMSKEDWTKELPRLRSRLDGKIGSVLKFSFDALEDEEKSLFLHIAWIFPFIAIEEVEEYLEKKFHHVRQQLVVLYEKSLISIKNGYVKIHGLLVELGRDIVRKQSMEPGQRQFLMDRGDITKVLNNDAGGLTSVIGITLWSLGRMKKININERAFEGMPNLEFLKIDGRLSHGPSYLSPNLRLLDWSYFPLACLPSPVNLKFLVELSMRRSKLEKLWEGNKSIRKLIQMDLRGSKKLKELPNLSTATSLKALILERCSSLVEMPSSIGKATNLHFLNLSYCSSLEKLPSSIGNATNLLNLNLSHCSSLVEIPSSIGKTTNLQILDLSYCSRLVKLPSSIGNLPKLRYLDFKGCSKLEVLPVNVNLKSLDRLDLSGCSSLKTFPEISTNIINLNLSGTAIEEMPSSIKTWCRLVELILGGCKNLLSLPQLPESLQKLKAVNCESLERLDCSCSNSNIDFNFANCFKLNKDARDLIIQTSTNVKGHHVLPGKEIPAYFTHRAKEGCLVLKLNERPLPFKLKFKACILLVSKNGVEDSDEGNEMEDRVEENDVEDGGEENDSEDGDGDDDDDVVDGDEENDSEDGNEENDTEDSDEDDESEYSDEDDDSEYSDEDDDSEYSDEDDDVEDGDEENDSAYGDEDDDVGYAYVEIMDKHNNLGGRCYDDGFDLQNPLTEHLYIFEFEADVPTHKLFIKFSIDGDELVIRECGVNYEDGEADSA